MNYKKIKYNSNYLVSDTGEVFSNHRNKHLKKQIHNGKQPYYTVKIFNKLTDKYEHFLVHRLVAEAFIPNPLNLDQVNHIDCNPQNNNVDNLEWVTNRCNTIHAYNNGLNSDTFTTEVYKDNKLVGKYRSLRNACSELGLSYKGVHYHTYKGNVFETKGFKFVINKEGDK